MSEPFIAEIRIFAGNFAPRGWAFCDGQLLPISQNTALFSLIGTMYGGDGRTTVALPDLRGRNAIHAGRGPGLSSFSQGEKAGGQTHLTAAALPGHTHVAQLHAENKAGTTGNPTGNLLARAGGLNTFAPEDPADNKTMHVDSVVVEAAGAAAPAAVVPISPYLGIYHIIALVGLYPSRS